MTDHYPPLTPLPLPVLLGRVVKEWQTRRRIFGLPARRFFRSTGADGEPTCSLATEIAGCPVATPLGPAAGPHTQLAQNFVLGWLAGARSFELKTVQVLDQLELERPCIDMETIGFNVEWSQELTLDQSLTEYVKAWLMLEILSAWPPLREVLGEPGGHVFELSLGYDLAGIQSDRMRRLIDGLRDASQEINRLRPQIPEPFAQWRDHDFVAEIVPAATISTFHGCPPDQVEAIVRHLMTAHGLEVTVKLNPTLLGQDRVAEILYDRLGYRDLELVPEAFVEDLDLPGATTLIENLETFARQHDRIFGIKLTNTLVVGNNRGVLPGERMYLSGPPLHALAIALLDLLQETLPGKFRLGGQRHGIPVAFSAGIDRKNVLAAVELGLNPVTICSDLLKPGGYGRLRSSLKHLQQGMDDGGCADLEALIARAAENAHQAGYRDAVAAYAASLTDGVGAEPYSRDQNSKLPRSEDRDLRPIDCSDCGHCVLVCPNNAMLALDTPAVLQNELTAKRQYFCLSEICNECGNCTTFCPERGDPCRIKPRLFIDSSRFDTAEGCRFLLSARQQDGQRELMLTAQAAEPDLVRFLETILPGPAGIPLRLEDLERIAGA